MGRKASPPRLAALLLLVLHAAGHWPLCVHAIPTAGDYMVLPMTEAAMQQSMTTQQSQSLGNSRRGFFGRRLLQGLPSQAATATGGCPIQTAARSASRGGVVLTLGRPSEGEAPVSVDGLLATPSYPLEWAMTGVPRNTTLYYLYDDAGAGAAGCTPRRSVGLMLGQAQKCSPSNVSQARSTTVCVAAVLARGWVASLEGTAVMASAKGDDVYARPSSLQPSTRCTSGRPGGSCTWSWIIPQAATRMHLPLERSIVGFEACFSAPGVTDADQPFPLYVSLAYTDGRSQRTAATPTACCGDVSVVAPQCQAARATVSKADDGAR